MPDHGLSVIDEDYSVDGLSADFDTAQALSNDTTEPWTKRKTDEKLVLVSRTVVVGVLMLSALLIAYRTYSLVAKDEYDNFKAEYHGNARQVIEMVNKNTNHIFESVETLAHTVTSAAHQAGTPLPYVTVEDFEQLGRSTQKISKAAILAYSPVLRTGYELEKWNTYSSNHSQWIEQGRDQALLLGGEEEDSEREEKGSDDNEGHRRVRQLEKGENETASISPYVFRTDTKGVAVRETPFGGYIVPLWQMSPVPTDAVHAVNFNLASDELFDELLDNVLLRRNKVLSRLVDAAAVFGYSTKFTNPASVLLQPVFQEVGSTHVAGVMSAVLSWQDFFDNVLSEDQSGILVVVDICGENTTFTIDGPRAAFVGAGDRHDNKFDDMEVHFQFGYESDLVADTFDCQHHIHIFPTFGLETSFQTTKPITYAMVTLCMFLFSGVVFFAYDWFVSYRQQNTEEKVKKSRGMLQELFPGNVAEKLFETKKKSSKDALIGEELPRNVMTNTIAQLYPSATVLFADIAGFTAWSSMRDPHQVFTLLESIFQAFDTLAKKLGIYKVETVGDCYMAVCGLPTPNDEHAVHMARFAMSAMRKFSDVVRNLQLTLGPDTVDLGMRFGLHSGPVTAGVLRADRARFQLFGDTVNTASRIETTGKRGRIHLSEQTASELIKHGKEHWTALRDDAVEAKGKGHLITYWLTRASEKQTNASTVCDSEYTESEVPPEQVSTAPESLLMKLGIEDERASAKFKENERLRRLVDWNSKLLLQLLKRVVACREVIQAEGNQISRQMVSAASKRPVNKSADIIEMPSFSSSSAITSGEVSKEVVAQLHAFVSTIASLYNDNPFHNFEHASHVTMSVHKLLTRLLTPKDPQILSESITHYEDTYGIASDPLMHFSVVLAALVHDLDHPGVPNAQLMTENPSLGARYHGQSVAEQNSLDLAWNALLSPKFDALRCAIGAGDSELERCRQILVNSVLATDIFDKELSALRRVRWGHAFDESGGALPADLNRRATIVIEHLIQASDVSHTMQHWHVYQKWNKRLFNEMYQAYTDGRAETDPSIGWYEGELGFLDHYVIPLALKLRKCGVFGVCSDEYLTYATDNRREWAERGADIVQSFVVQYKDSVGIPQTTGTILTAL